MKEKITHVLTIALGCAIAIVVVNMVTRKMAERNVSSMAAPAPAPATAPTV
jgi:hypothetical protein